MRAAPKLPAGAREYVHVTEYCMYIMQWLHSSESGEGLTFLNLFTIQVANETKFATFVQTYRSPLGSL